MTRSRNGAETADSPRPTHTIVTVAVLVLIPALLAGCTYKPLVSNELEGFADQLIDLPGVADITLYVSDSPFEDNPTVTLTLDPDVQRADLDAVREVACASELRNETEITFRYEFDGGATLMQGPVARCWTEPLLFLGALPAFAAHADGFLSVNWGEYADGSRAGFDISLGDMTEDPVLSPDGVGPQAALLGDVLAALPDDGTVVYGTIDGISIGTMTLERARAAVAMISDVTGRYPVATAGLDDAVTATLVSTDPAVAAEATEYLAAMYPDFPLGEPLGPLQ